MDILSGRIFFLGAGFSANAGIPLTNKLLPAALQLFEREQPEFFERIANYAENIDLDVAGQPDAVAFAKFCTYLDFIELREFAGGERWSDRGCRERLALKYFLSKVIVNSTPRGSSIPECYLDFARNLTEHDVVVTFNWDTLLENTLEYLNIPYSYKYEDNKINIVKLHGSVNWIQGKPQKFGNNVSDFGYRALKIKGGLNKTEIYSSRALMDKSSWVQSKCLLDGINPMIVLPGYGKAVDARVLSYFWYRPEFLYIRNGGISIIGLSVSHDDYLVQSLFHYIFRATISDGTSITVINPDPSVNKTFRDLAGPSVETRFVERRFCSDSLVEALLRT